MQLSQNLAPGARLALAGLEVPHVREGHGVRGGGPELDGLREMPAETANRTENACSVGHPEDDRIIKTRLIIDREKTIYLKSKNRTKQKLKKRFGRGFLGGFLFKKICKKGEVIIILIFSTWHLGNRASLLYSPMALVKYLRKARVGTQCT